MKDIIITGVQALEILDSRGDPTIETMITLSNGIKAKASVPSGASTGLFEAFELRDNDMKRYGGKGVSKAVQSVQIELRDTVLEKSPFDQRAIDAAMIERDGTENKKQLGANAILSVSLAIARAAALASEKPLYEYLRSLTSVSGGYRMPIPLINIINGGKHASSNLDLQEFWIIPHKALTFKERIRQGSEVFHALGQLLTEHKMDTDVGNEGGYAPDMESHEQGFKLILEAIRQSSLTAGDDISLGMDAGSSVLFDTQTKRYSLPLDKASYTNDEMIDYLMHLVEVYPIHAIEDGLSEEEWHGWQELTEKMKTFNPDIRIIGDDLFVTNEARLKKGIDMGVANSILIKPNQIGTLTETLDTIACAHENGYATAVSHRSGETTDTFIADLSVAVNSEYIKTGSTARGERLAKYNRLLEIEHGLEESA